jgi:hypothetical protein
MVEGRREGIIERLRRSGETCSHPQQLISVTTATTTHSLTHLAPRLLLKMPSTSVIIAIVFIPIYFILALFSLALAIRDGFKREVGFLTLLIFSVVRCVGNILMVYVYYGKSTSSGLYIAAYLLQGLGYSFLVVSALALLLRVASPTHESHASDGVLGLLGSGLAKPVRLLQTASLVALIVLIVGYTNSPLFNNLSASEMAGTSSAGGYNIEVRVGDIIFVVVTIAFILLTLFVMVSPGEGKSTKLSCVLLAASAFMLASSIYSTITAFSSNPLGVNVWIKLVFLQISQALAASTRVFFGFIMRKNSPTISESDKNAPAEHVA